MCAPVFDRWMCINIFMSVFLFVCLSAPSVCLLPILNWSSRRGLLKQQEISLRQFATYSSICMLRSISSCRAKSNSVDVLVMNKCSDRSMEVELPVLVENYDRPTDQPTNRRAWWLIVKLPSHKSCACLIIICLASSLILNSGGHYRMGNIDGSKII